MSKDKRSQIKIDLKNINVSEILSSDGMDETLELEENYKVRRKAKPKRRLE